MKYYSGGENLITEDFALQGINPEQQWLRKHLIRKETTVWRIKIRFSKEINMFYWELYALQNQNMNTKKGR